jgi:glycosyltransferase involved in cell wall biosynthesis
MKTLSIIVPVYNEEATLQELVEKVINVDLSSV